MGVHCSVHSELHFVDSPLIIAEFTNEAVIQTRGIKSIYFKVDNMGVSAGVPKRPFCIAFMHVEADSTYG